MQSGVALLARGLLAAMAGAALAAQEPVGFRTADGSRFWLIATGGPLVHWALAAPAGAQEDPPGFEGLALACARASLQGTWHTGSRDAAAERAALEQADQAGDAAAAAARALADPRAFLRVLGGAPAMDIGVDDRQACTVLSLTTTEDGIGKVAELLVERREDAALRGLHEAWQATAADLRQRSEQDPLWALCNEAVALCYPGHPDSRALERPAPGARPDRATALQVWRRTQRPDRCVHVLTGGFDPVAVRAQLERAFAATALRDPVPALPAPRALPSARRSSVPGNGGGVVLAFRLHGNEKEADLRAAVHWLGTGPDSWFGRALAALPGRLGTARAHLLQPGVGTPGLLLVEITGKASSAELAELSLAACGMARLQVPTAVEAEAAAATTLAEWERSTRTPRLLAAALAERALLRPDDPPLPVLAAPGPAALGQALQALFTNNQPAVVERQPL